MGFNIQKIDDLNCARIADDGGDDVHFSDERRPLKFSGVSGEVHFRDLENVLVREIEKHSVVVGCVAWLTNERALRAMAKCDLVSIIVNKEDFLRPDKGTWSQQKVKELYAALPSGERWPMGLEYSCNSDPTLEAVRCAGVHGKRQSVPPRMHHKFLVLGNFRCFRCEYDSAKGEFSRREVSALPHGYKDGVRLSDGSYYDRDFESATVWTGSFNISQNGTRSLENVIIIRDRGVADSYLAEWKIIQGISEPLNWDSEYVDPEWRIGT